MAVSAKQQRFIVDVLDDSAWPGLVVLWISLAVAWLMTVREPDTLWPVVLVVVWLGSTWSSALSGRAGWWWTGLASMVLGLAGGAVAGWLTRAAYPASDLAWTPFAAGASLRWQYSGAVVVLGVAVSVAVRSRVHESGLARAALVSLVATFYLFRGPFPASPDEVPMGLIALTLTVLAVGAADHIAAHIAANRALYQTAVTSVSLAGLLMVAGSLWRFILIQPIDPFFGLGERHVNNVLPVATLALVATLATAIGVRVAARHRRIVDAGHPMHPPNGAPMLWYHATQEPIFWILSGGLLGVVAGRTTIWAAFDWLDDRVRECSLPLIRVFRCDEGMRLDERFYWLLLIAGAAAGIAIALAIWLKRNRHRTA